MNIKISNEKRLLISIRKAIILLPRDILVIMLGYFKNPSPILELLGAKYYLLKTRMLLVW